MATTPMLLSINKYLRTSYCPDVHFVDGVLEERNLGEYQHGRTKALLAAFFVANEKAWRIDALISQRIRVSASRIRVCDVTILRADAPREEVTQTPPLICIEVLSPEDRLARAKVVLADYLAMGVPNIWLIDPIRRVAYTFDGTGLHETEPSGLSVPGTAIRLDLADLFARLDKK